MSSVSVFVGLDYHQDSVQVCVIDEQGRPLSNRSVANDAAAVRSGQVGNRGVLRNRVLQGTLLGLYAGSYARALAAERSR